jgi:hypothetical protein
MRIKIAKLAGDAAVLAGKNSGWQVFMRLVEATEVEPREPEALFLDFAGIDVATGSFLRESVLGFRDHVRGRRSNFYPVVANAGEAVRDELQELLRPRGGALMACVLADDGEVTKVMLIGDLEPKQRMTFELVAQRGETDASELKRNHGDEVQVTAWNNRLTALATLGLVVEITQGRTKRYRPLFGEA